MHGGEGRGKPGLAHGAAAGHGQCDIGAKGAAGVGSGGGRLDHPVAAGVRLKGVYVDGWKEEVGGMEGFI